MAQSHAPPLTLQSILTVPHWITSFSTQTVDILIIKPFPRTRAAIFTRRDTYPYVGTLRSALS